MTQAATVTAAVLVIGDEILSGPHQGHQYRLYRRLSGQDRRRSARGRVVPTRRPRSSPRSTRCGCATTISSRPGASARPMTTSPPTPWRRPFGVAISEDPRAITLLLERIKPEDLNEARRRMARIPDGAELIENGFRRRRGSRSAMSSSWRAFPRSCRRCSTTSRPGSRPARHNRRDDCRRRSVRGRLCGGARRHRGGQSRAVHRLLSLVPGRRLPQRDRRARLRRECRGRRRSTARCLLGLAKGGPKSNIRNAHSHSAPAEKAFHVSWDQFHRDARALAWRLSAARPFSGMVAVTRGGLVPAAIVARELNLRIIDTFCVVSYGGETTQGDTKS